MKTSRTARLIGFSLLGASTLAWLAGLGLPLSGWALPHKGWWTTGLLVSGELLFAASVYFLGKEYGQRLKRRARVCWWRLRRLG